MIGIEQRKYERLDLTIPANLELTGNGADGSVLCLETTDICAGGAFFNTSHTLPVGTKVKINFILSVSKLSRFVSHDFDCKHVPLTVQGRVLRSTASGFAVSFVGGYQISNGRFWALFRGKGRLKGKGQRGNDREE